jgi:glycosyltransferase involved in cell wall biosynthesis
VPGGGLPVHRWWRYAKALRRHAADADIVEAFSSVSCGVPLWLAKIANPKKVLRLGGDFFWERYTGRGGMKSLREWYASRPPSQRFMQWLLSTFDHIIFSTRFQEELYGESYASLPAHSAIENAVPAGNPVLHQRHDPFRLLFMGRFVGFKNLLALFDAACATNDSALTFVGDGPMCNILKGLAAHLGSRVRFLPPVHGPERERIFAEHDLLILPSVTEISPNVALEARAAGLPVLLTEETGLSPALTHGMTLAPLRTPEEIARAVHAVRERYDEKARAAAGAPPSRSWGDVAEEHLALFRSLL